LKRKKLEDDHYNVEDESDSGSFCYPGHMSGIHSQSSPNKKRNTPSDAHFAVEDERDSDSFHYPDRTGGIHSQSISSSPNKKRNTSPAPLELTLISAHVTTTTAIKRKFIEDDEYDVGPQPSVPFGNLCV
jgi:hypothetical protein